MGQSTARRAEAQPTVRGEFILAVSGGREVGTVRGSWGARGDIQSRDFGHERQGRHGLFACGHRLAAGGFRPVGRAGRALRAFVAVGTSLWFHVHAQAPRQGDGRQGPQCPAARRRRKQSTAGIGHVSFRLVVLGSSGEALLPHFISGPIPAPQLPLTVPTHVARQAGLEWMAVAGRDAVVLAGAVRERHPRSD